MTIEQEFSRQQRNFMNNKLPPCDHDECPPTHYKQPSPDDLAKAIDEAFNDLSPYAEGDGYCGKVTMRAGCVHSLAIAAKRVQEMEGQIGCCSKCGFKAWSNEENNISHCLYCSLEQSSRDKDELIEKLVEALNNNRITVSSSGAGHVCVGCGEPFQHPHKDFCLIDKALSLAHAQGFGKK